MFVQDEHGRLDFAGLRSAIEGEPHRLLFMAFDLVELDGEDLRPESLRLRRQKLLGLIGKYGPGTPIQFSESQQGGRARKIRTDHAGKDDSEAALVSPRNAL